MLGNSLGLILARAFSMGLGFLFWLVAARLFAPSVVGLTAGAISAIMLCVQLALLGTGSAVIAEYPDRHRRGELDRLLDAAVTLVTVTALVVAAVFLLLAAGTFRELRAVGSLPAYTVLFLGMSVLGTVALLLDHVSTAQGRGDHVLARSALNGLVTLAPLALLPVATGTIASLRLFAVWVAGGLAACALAFLQLGRKPVRYRYRPRVDWEVTSALVKRGLPNHALTLLERAPGLILPVVVTELLSPSVNAYWYTIWMMAWAAYFVPISVGISLFAEISHRPRSTRREVRNAIRSSLVLGLAAAGAVGLLGQPLLTLLGHGYASAGVTPLRILVVAVLPLSFIQAYFAACRATGRLPEAIAMGGASALLAIAATTLTGRVYGLTGMAVCWVAVQAAGGAWAAVRLPWISVPRQGPGVAVAEGSEQVVPAR